jgi:glycosyltransferase involved in cell wall biosynthesis
VISQYTFEQAVRRTLVHIAHETDIIYGHFFYPAGRSAAQLGRAYGIPSVVRHGEGCLHARYLKRGTEDFADISGVISNTRRLKRYCEQELGIPDERVRVFLNGVDRSIFYPRDRVAMRRRLRLPLGQFLVAFVGYFSELKGPHRVLKAIQPLEDVSALFIGSHMGPDRIDLRGNKAAFIGAVEHSLLPEYLSSADAFVLPTTMEGCCNAILEAMACGVPIVSSNSDFNDEIIDDEVAIRVDPDDTDQIRQAILTLKENPGLRETFSKACLLRSRQFDINTRAREVAEWFGEIVARDGGMARQCCSDSEGI